MKIKAKNSYRNTKGNTVFVYTVSGTPEQLEQYRAAQGNLYKETEDGTPIWFTTRYIGEQGTLIITSKGNVIADTSAFDKAASIAKQYGGNLGDHLIQAVVGSMLGNFNVSQNTNSVNPTANEPKTDDAAGF